MRRKYQVQIRESGAEVAHRERRARWDLSRSAQDAAALEEWSRAQSLRAG